MISLKCKSCGGELEIIEESTVCECEFCGLKQTVPVVDDEKKIKLYERANKLRYNCDFDKALGAYESIVSEFSDEAEAYWGLILCKYGIEYVDDPATGKKVPTCHRSSFESIMDDPDFEMVMENADLVSRQIYREEAKYIEELRKGIIEISGKEEPYDIFICYKETAESGERTLDSVLAQDIYDELTGKGYRVFFSRISLEDKLGTEYEPYIFAALNSAKIMLAFGTSYDYYNAVWVKNEWSRFLKLIATDKSKHLIPCYKDIDAYDIPKEFAKLQAQDLGKVGATQDLIRGIDKLIGNNEETNAATAVTAPVVQQIVSGGPNVEALLKRGYMALEDGYFEESEDYFDKVLNMDAECGNAYLGILMGHLKCKSENELHTAIVTRNILNLTTYKRAKQFASTEMLEKFNEWEEEQATRLKREQEEAEKLAAEKAEQLAAEKAERKAEEARKKAEFDRISKLIINKEYELTAKDQEALDRLKRDIDAATEERGKAENNYYSLSEHKKVRKLETLIAEKREYLLMLGIFKIQEKKTVKEEIACLESEKGACAALLKKSKDIWDEKTRLEVDLKIKYEEKRKVLENQHVQTLVDNLIANAIDEDSVVDFIGESPYILKTYPDLINKYPIIINKYPGVCREASKSILATVKVGDEIVLGEGNNTWIVIEIKDGKVLLISKYLIGNRSFNKDNNFVTWEKCTLREWLNNDYLNSAFNEIERNAIVESCIKNDDNPILGTAGGKDTVDRIFLLSFGEAKKYFATDRARIAMNAEGKSAVWWLRTPGRESNRAAFVLEAGALAPIGPYVDSDYVAVRPALWIDISSL